MRKAGNLFGGWSQEGNILIKIAEDDQPTLVQDHDALKKLLNETNGIPNDQEMDGDSQQRDDK